MFIKKETFTNEDGIDMVREYYGRDEENISGTVEYPVPDEDATQIPWLPESTGSVEPEATQLDRIEAQTAYITMML